MFSLADASACPIIGYPNNTISLVYYSAHPPYVIVK